LGDTRAIPLLAQTMNLQHSEGNDDSDSDDIFAFVSTERLVVESCIALATFINDEEAKNALLNGCKHERTREACLAVLYTCTKEKQYLELLEEAVKTGKTFDYYIVHYLRNHAETSEDLVKLLQLNEEIEMAKKVKTDND
ncbi:unnamed protein product, partial [Didymodactylos carnosus]